MQIWNYSEKSAYYWSSINGFSSNNRTISVNIPGTYFITVDSINGCSSLLDSVVLSNKSCPNGVKDISVASNFSIYPNPALESVILQIESMKNENATVSIYNLVGQVLLIQNIKLTSGSNQIALNVNELSGGNYFVQVSSDNLSQRMQLVVQD